MKNIALLVTFLFSTAVMAEEKPLELTCRPVTLCEVKPVTTCVCPIRKPAPKKIVKKKPAAKAVVEQKTTVVVNVVPAPVPAAAPVKKKVKPEPEREPAVFVGLRVAGGAGLSLRPPVGFDHNTSGLVGLRLRVPSLLLGAEVYTAFERGLIGGQLLFYPYQGKRLNLQVNIGVLKTGKYLLSTYDIPRTWDVTFGTGVEVRLIRHLSFTADLRSSFPDPTFVAANNQVRRDAAGNVVYGPAGRYIDTRAALGNTIGQTQLLLGLMLTN